MSGSITGQLAFEESDDKKDTGKRAYGTNPTGQRGSEDFPDAEKIHHFHPDWQIGSKCTCGKGRLKEFRRNKKLPSKALILAGSVFRSEVHVFHDLRCNSCDEVFRVPPSEKACAEGLERGAGGLSYGYSAIALIAIQTYFYGIPWYRSSKMTGSSSLPVSRSTMQDQVEKLSCVIRPMIGEMFSQAANCWLQMGDDTSRKVFELAGCSTEPVSDRKTKGRCSLVVGFRENDSYPVAIVKIGLQHTGDLFDDLLKERDRSLKPPLLMSDGAGCNQTSSGLAIHLSCLQHARDYFVKCKKDWTEKDLIPLKLINRLFKNDRATTDMNSEDRLSYHQENSSGITDQLFDECERILKEVAPPASALGESAHYVLNRKEELTGFLKHPGAPLSNNLIESLFGSVIAITRKNSGPHKNILGATWAADILSVGITALLCGLNLQQYFVFLLQHTGEIKLSPSEYLPWNFQMDSSGTITRRKIDKNKILPLSQAPPPPFRAPLPKPALTRPEKYLEKLLAG